MCSSIDGGVCPGSTLSLATAVAEGSHTVQRPQSTSTASLQAKKTFQDMYVTGKGTSSGLAASDMPSTTTDAD